MCNVLHVFVSYWSRIVAGLCSFVFLHCTCTALFGAPNTTLLITPRVFPCPSLDRHLVGHPAPVHMAVVLRVRLPVRLPDQSQHHVDDERAQTGVRVQQHSPRSVHTDAVAVRVERDVGRVQSGVGRGRERRDFVGRAPRHRGPGPELRGRVAGHKRDDRRVVHQRFAVHRWVDHVPTGTENTTTSKVGVQRKH